MHDDFKAAKDFFNNMAQNWDSTFTPDPEKIKLITSLCPIPDRAEIIDIACGTGALFPFLLSAGPSKILGVDISEKMLEEASKKFQDPRIKLLCANFFDVEETGFDRAFIYRAYPHFHDKTAFIKHLHHTQGRRPLYNSPYGKPKSNKQPPSENRGRCFRHTFRCRNRIKIICGLL